MNTRIIVAFIILTAILSAALVYTYYVRRGLINEGFADKDLDAVEEAVREAVPQLDSATISRTLEVIRRLSSQILSPTFFTNTLRMGTMTPMELAREYIKSQKQNSEKS